MMNQWYYGMHGQQIGPVAESELRQLIAQGVVTRETMVWREGMAEWRAMAEVNELAGPPVPGYGMGGYPSGYVVAAPNSGLAIASMCCGIAGIVFQMCYIGGFVGIAAVIMGHIALKKIKESEVPMAGKGMAIAGLITGYISIVLMVLVVCFFSFFFINAANMSP
jgi:hypothetical protein